MKRIAVPYESGQIFQRFGHAPQFKFYDVLDRRVFREQVVAAPAKKGHTALAAFLKNMSTNTLICDRIGENGKRALETAGIELHTGINGNADDAVKALIEVSFSKKEIADEKRKPGASLDVPISFY